MTPHPLPPVPRHRLLVELGRGGMGTVYLAVTDGPGGFHKLKVVKRLRARPEESAEFVHMFLDEARLAARLAHPNVVQTYDVGFDGLHYFLEMEYLEGQALDALQRACARRGGFPLREGAWILAQALAGLQYAHDLRGIDGEPLSVVHRDVSPHNVFVTYDGRVKVLDFGVAKAADSSFETRTGIVKGKPTYMAPEQAARRPVDRRADVFSVGVILWELATGRRMWAGLDDESIFARLASGRVDDVLSSGDLPQPVRAICRRALAREPDDRFATAAEFGAALEELVLQTGEPIGPSHVAPLMNELFAETRALMGREIEAQLRELRAPHVPPAASGAERTVSWSTQGHTLDVERAPSRPTHAATPDAVRVARPWGRRRVGVSGALALGVAFVGLASAAGSGVFAPGERSLFATASQTGAPATLAPRCASSRACVEALGKPAVCHADGACRALESEDCRVLAEPGDVEDDRTIWLGAMFPTSGSSGDEFGQVNANALDLARKDFASVAHGLPSATGEGRSRPIGIVMCDDARSPQRAARHLVEDVRVPAVVGFRRSEELIDLAASTFLPNRVMALSSLNTSALVTGIPHPPGVPRLVWRTTVSATQLAAPVAALILRLRDDAGRAHAVAPPQRLLLVRADTISSLSFSEALFSALRESGTPVDLIQRVIGTTPDGEDARRLEAEALAFAPQVIVLEGANLEKLAPALEARWPNAKRPTYVTVGTLRERESFDAVERFPDLRRRVLSVDLPASTEENARFVLRYNEVFARSITEASAPGVTYDAFYAFAYAAFAAGDVRLTGPAIAQGMTRLVPPGVPVGVGPTKIFDAINALRSGKNIDLAGAGTKLDFDVETGDVATDYAVYCIPTRGSSGAYESRESGLTYDARAKRLAGTMRCP